MRVSLRVTAAAVAFAAIPALVAAQADPRPVRAFPQFAGTWVLDEAASTGSLTIAPRIPLRMTIAISPTEITVTKEPRYGPRDNVRDRPPEVYRLDGVETRSLDEGTALDRVHRFTLVADMLALTVKDLRPGRPSFTQVTDGLEVDGDVLTLHRQLTSVTAAGEILVMQEPTNNFRHTFVYRRAP